MPLEREAETYRREMGRLLAEGHAGRHALIKGDEVVSVWDTRRDALQASRALFGPEEIAVVKIDPPHSEPGVAAGDESLQDKFTALVKLWKKDTETDSSILRMIRHPAYQQIIDLGEAVIPLLLTELRREPDFWFAALQKITGANPAPPESAGKVKQLARAWIEWGRQKGYIQ